MLVRCVALPMLCLADFYKSSCSSRAGCSDTTMSLCPLLSSPLAKDGQMVSSMSAEAYVAFLRAHHSETLAKAQGIKPNQRGKTYESQVPPESPSCLICGVQKHSHKWQYRLGKNNVRLCVGATCRCCVQAAARLKCSRSPAVLSDVNAKCFVEILSRKLRREMKLPDTCGCVQCGEKTMV